ncbi:MAG TPA: glycosyltransferase, partial [Candidatus Limnocylindrales bacterium]|nr:glycosyltransferase [Candidatus Limnocylindrales bacterium]
MRVAFLGAFDPEYPRTRVLREGLQALGVDVRLLPVTSRRGAREAALFGAWATRGGGADAYLVPSFGHRDVPLAAALARVAGVPLLFDPLVSRWDTQTRDLGRVAPRSLAAARLHLSDAVALRLADLVLCDTWEHGELFAERFGVPRRKLARVPVGADHAAFALGAERAARKAQAALAPTAARPISAVYVGGFLPLHGVPAIVGAAALLERRHGPAFAQFTLIGDGMTAHEADRDVASLGLRSVRREPRLPYAGALELLAGADVALGIFGTTEKAARVVPHKVYQALALGVPTVTRRSPAVAEFFERGRSAPAGEPLFLVPPGSAEALAGAIEELARDPARR